MSDNDAVEDILDDDLTDGLEKKKLSGKKLVIFGGAGIVLLLVITLTVLLLMGGEEEEEEVDTVQQQLDQLAEDAAARQQELEDDVPSEELQLLFLHLDNQLYNLNAGARGTSFLRTNITLEVDRQSYLDDLQVKLPRILDEFNVYMRELRPEDLDGAEGMFRLKEELLLRINQAVAPTRVRDVLFQEFVVQAQ